MINAFVTVRFDTIIFDKFDTPVLVIFWAVTGPFMRSELRVVVPYTFRAPVTLLYPIYNDPINFLVK
jgi:hypothetical protein